MNILDNEGHDPQGFGNQRASAKEVLCACTSSCAKDAEIERLRAALDAIGAMFYVGQMGAVLLKPEFGNYDVLDAANAALAVDGEENTDARSGNQGGGT